MGKGWNGPFPLTCIGICLTLNGMRGPLDIILEVPEAYCLTRQEVNQAVFMDWPIEVLARMALDRMALKIMGGE